MCIADIKHCNPYSELFFMFSRPCSTQRQGSVFAAFDQTDASITHKMNLLNRQIGCNLGFFIAQTWILDFQLKEECRKRVLGWPIPYFYSSVFPEPSIKHTQVEPEAGTITFSCNSAVKGKQKVEGGECMRLSLLIDGSSKSLTKSKGT